MQKHKSRSGLNNGSSHTEFLTLQNRHSFCIQCFILKGLNEYLRKRNTLQKKKTYTVTRTWTGIFAVCVNASLLSMCLPASMAVQAKHSLQLLFATELDPHLGTVTNINPHLSPKSAATMVHLLNPFVTSGTYMSHLQRVFSSPLG